MKRFFAWITALLMLLSLAACSSTQTSTAAASQQASTSETAKSENELLAEENDILAANNALWEKVFASMDKNVTDTTLSSNYGDILMSALDHAKDQFTDEEYAAHAIQKMMLYQRCGYITHTDLIYTFERDVEDPAVLDNIIKKFLL